MGELGEYRRRRDPKRTPEPVPDAATEPLPRGDDDTFVVQEYHASFCTGTCGWNATPFRLTRSGSRTAIGRGGSADRIYRRGMKTPDLVLVPALVGLDAAQAHEVAMAARVVAVDPEPDTPPTLTGTVIAQQPEPGERIPAGDAVTVWIDDTDGGGGGGGGSLQPDSPPPKDPAGVK